MGGGGGGTLTNEFKFDSSVIPDVPESHIETFPRTLPEIHIFIKT